MKPPSKLRITGIAFATLGVAACLAGQTNRTVGATTPVKTTFVDGAKLTDAEVKQVVALALQCGIPDVAEVETFQYIPGVGRGVTARSKDRVVGRAVACDTVTINRTDWGGLMRDPGAKWSGHFSVNPPFKATTLLREFIIDGKSIRIGMGEGVGAAFVDKVVLLIAAKRVRFRENDFMSQNQFERIKFVGKEVILKSDTQEGYEMWFHGSMNVLSFKLEGDKVVILGVSPYNI